MRNVGRKSLLVAALSALLVSASGSVAATPATGSVTVAPAALTLRLTKGESTASTNFFVTNNYSATVTLHFAFERPSGATGVDTRPQLSLLYPDLTIEAGQKTSQTIKFQDATSIEPGSQAMELVVSQAGNLQTGIGVAPSMHLPVTLIKDDGAVTSLGMTSIASPGLTMTLPHDIAITLHNTGNMVAIPRGTVTISSPNGTVLGKGTLNEGSVAVAPGADIKLTTKIPSQTNGVLPGPYRVAVAYGLGGDDAGQVSTARFIYIAWWHIAILAILLTGVLYLGKHTHRLWPSKKSAQRKAPPKRSLLIGRDLS